MRFTYGHDWRNRSLTISSSGLLCSDLAFQTANGDEIDKNIKQIGRIEGSTGLLGRFCQVRYLIWQAQQAAQGSTKSTASTYPSSSSFERTCFAAAGLVGYSSGFGPTRAAGIVVPRQAYR